MPQGKLRLNILSGFRVVANTHLRTEKLSLFRMIGTGVLINLFPALYAVLVERRCTSKCRMLYQKRKPSAKPTPTHPNTKRRKKSTTKHPCCVLVALGQEKGTLDDTSEQRNAND